MAALAGLPPRDSSRACLVHEGREKCGAPGDSDAPDAAFALPLRARRRRCTAAAALSAVGGSAALLAAVALLALASRGSGALREAAAAAGTGAPLLGLQNVEVQHDHNGCEMYFAVGKDCSKKNLWECGRDDGSRGFACCCKHGWGDFSYTSEHASGVILWSAHPHRCLDLSNPYVGSGKPFKSSWAMIANCNWGNPNKEFRVPTKGKGQIRWATHLKFCLGVKDGTNIGGNTLTLQRCEESPSKWTTFDFGSKGLYVGHEIRWAAHPTMCLTVNGEKDGSQVQLHTCRGGGAASQLFNASTPPLPPPWADKPRLFCISLMLPTGYEAGLLADQHAHQVGIFKCNEFAVYSNKYIVLTHGSDPVATDVMAGSLKVQFGGRWHSALNTDVFIRFWAKVVTDKRAWRNDWTVKIDPDAVFFPDRLREMLRNRWYGGNPKAAVYLNNCHRGMHGPIEVLSKQALRVYMSRWKECKNGEPYRHKQEDFYYRRCWKLLGIEKVDVFNLLFENLYACDERSDTRDGRHPCFSRQVSFHPFKSSASYFQCYKRGNAMRWSTPMFINSEVPGKKNFHHA